MKRIVSLGAALILFVAALPAQGTPPAADEPIKGESRTEVVDQVWRMATQGELLTPEGWSKACGFFTSPTPFPGTKVILVVSNDWGPSYDDRSKDDSTDAEMGYVDMGKVDSALRYTPPLKTEIR
jgi:hypothetical protein